MTSETPSALPDVTALNNACHALAREVAAEFKAQPTPQTIYHYTDDVGLRGILESGELWLTDIYSLNDPSEVRFSVNMGIAAIQRFAQEIGEEHAKITSSLPEGVNNSLETKTYPFVCSFSRTKNDIGQWRAYADDGQGYALAFDGPLLVQAFEESQPRDGLINTFNIGYGDKRLNKLHADIIALARPMMAAPHPDLIYTVLLNNILASGLLFKHAAYESEKEFRFSLYYSGKGLHLMPTSHTGRRHALVPYRKFNWRRTQEAALKQIIVGPAVDRTRAFRFVNGCLSKFHKGSVEVEQSDIPYRRTRG